MDTYELIAACREQGAVWVARHIALESQLEELKAQSREALRRSRDLLQNTKGVYDKPM